MTKCVEILSVGTELLLGEIVNSDAAFIAGEIAKLGFLSYCQGVVGDNAQRLEEAVSHALSRSDILIITGGLGPTCDDITKSVTADFFGLEMHEEQSVKQDIENYFKDIGRNMTANNLLQALVPEGAVIFKNRWGTAPGLAVTGKPRGAAEEKTAILLPGPPKELEPMFTNEVIPYLKRFSDQTIYSLNLHLYGIGESAAEDILRPIMDSGENPTVAPYAAEYEVRIRITAKGETEEICREMCRKTAEEIRKTEAGKYIYAESEPEENPSDTIVLHLMNLLREKKMMIGTAESCTAGMISSRIADIPGSSDVLAGGIVSYSNEVKKNVLGVAADTLERCGAVSEECAEQMARGALEALGCDIAVSVTGIAGPGGGTEKKPVGTVCFGVADKNGAETKTMHFGSLSDRGKIRRLTTAAAMMTAVRRIKGTEI